MVFAQQTRSHGSKLIALSLIFIAWKLLIGLIVFSSPGIGYDTSSDLLGFALESAKFDQDVPNHISHQALKLIRWDAIYYTTISHRGHLFEQEWAFGKGFSATLNLIQRGYGFTSNHVNYGMLGITLSHVAHGLSVTLLYKLTEAINAVSEPKYYIDSTVVAILHVMSPAGVFLSAPYTESLFSFLNILGFFSYTKSVQAKGLAATFSKLCAGIAFGLAATIRGNGLLSGIPFFLDALGFFSSKLNLQPAKMFEGHGISQFLTTIVAGSFVGLGAIYPQYLGFEEYCVNALERRPWCNAALPSIFTFVQSHYWNVGFLRYWTLSNIPLFLLAIPSLAVLLLSGWQGVLSGLKAEPTRAESLQLRLALPQLVLAMLALTNYHVQIITRLSSAYPFWYMWLARNMGSWNHATMFVRIFICYGIIQAALFASFLPPA